MDPSGRLRRRRRVAMTKKGAAAVPIEENRQPSPVLEQPVFEMAALESDKTKPVESEMNGHATAEPVEKDEKLSVGAKSTDNQLAANGLVPEASSKAGFTTPTKEKTRAVTRARRGNGARGAVDVESSPPKMRTRSAVKAERKITDFFRPAENGEAAATNGAVTPPPSPISMAFRSPVLDGNEEKENKVAPVLGASAKPSSTHVRVLNWEPESVEHSTAKTLMPTPPHRIQSPLKPEVREVRCRSTTPPGAVGVVEDILSTLSPSSALNKMKISFDEPPKRLPEEPVVKERVRRPRKPATPKKRPQEPQQPQPLPPPPPPPAHPEQPKQQQQASHTKQSTLTTFFQPIRRSSRKTKAALAKETEWQIAEAVRNGKEDGLSVENFPCKGRGIVAARPFTKGEFVVEYSGELIDMKEAEVREAQYARDKTAGCYMYYFEHQNRQLCVDATKESGRMGRLINHSRSHANLTTKTIMIDDAPRLVLFAGRDIAENEELLYDYGDRRKESLANYPWLAF